MKQLLGKNQVVKELIRKSETQKPLAYWLAKLYYQLQKEHKDASESLDT